MEQYDGRRITLDPGLTALALRGLKTNDGHYPFVERHIGRRRRGNSSTALRALLTAWFPTVHILLAGRPTTG